MSRPRPATVVEYPRGRTARWQVLEAGIWPVADYATREAAEKHARILNARAPKSKAPRRHAEHVERMACSACWHTWPAREWNGSDGLAYVDGSWEHVDPWTDHTKDGECPACGSERVGLVESRYPLVPVHERRSA